MKWKLPFTSRYARIENKLNNLEALIGEPEHRSTWGSSVMMSFYGFTIPKEDITTRLKEIENKLYKMEVYLNIAIKTTEKKSGYFKVIKKTK